MVVCDSERWSESELPLALTPLYRDLESVADHPSSIVVAVVCWLMESPVS